MHPARKVDVFQCRTFKPTVGPMDTTAALQEIGARITSRVFGAVHGSDQGPAVRHELAEMLDVLDRTSGDGVI